MAVCRRHPSVLSQEELADLHIAEDMLRLVTLAVSDRTLYPRIRSILSSNLEEDAKKKIYLRRQIDANSELDHSQLLESVELPAQKCSARAEKKGGGSLAPVKNGSSNDTESDLYNNLFGSPKVKVFVSK